MTYNLSMNYSSFSDVGRDISYNMPSSVPLVLTFIYLLIVLMGSLGSKKLNNISNTPMWMAISGLVTATITFILYLVDRLVSPQVLGIAIAVAIGSAMFYFLSED